MSATIQDQAHTRTWRVHHANVDIRTLRRVEFIDITDVIADQVRRSGVRDGIVNVQTLHTTTAVRVNENESLLIEDLEMMLEWLAPRNHRWRHDDIEARGADLPPDERANGHAHARALLLGTSESLNVIDGDLVLGRWQRIFFVELDGRRNRRLSVTVTGAGRAELRP
jgi:secondary thiamine-phosphate synthase enzyme